MELRCIYYYTSHTAGKLHWVIRSHLVFSGISGKQKVQLDFYLCYAEDREQNKAISGDILLREQINKLQHTTLLLELVYFFWFEERQLARGAKMLTKVTYVWLFGAFLVWQQRHVKTFTHLV